MRALADDVIYEVHLRGSTAGDAALPCAGTYAGAAARAAELAALGVTAVEFLPVQETGNDANDVDPASNSGSYSLGSTRRWRSSRPIAATPAIAAPAAPLASGARWSGVPTITVLKAPIPCGLQPPPPDAAAARCRRCAASTTPAHHELSSSGTGFYDSTGIGANTNARHRLFRRFPAD